MVFQYVLDHLRTQMCLTQVGRSFRYLTFEPMINFYNLYEFMNMVSWYVEQSEKPTFEVRGVGCNIHTLKFTFPCNMNSREDERIRLFGTGGEILRDILAKLVADICIEFASETLYLNVDSV